MDIISSFFAISKNYVAYYCFVHQSWITWLSYNYPGMFPLNVALHSIFCSATNLSTKRFTRTCQSGRKHFFTRKVGYVRIGWKGNEIRGNEKIDNLRKPWNLTLNAPRWRKKSVCRIYCPFGGVPQADGPDCNAVVLRPSSFVFRRSVIK